MVGKIGNIAALLGATALAHGARADVKEISVTVKGITCPVCTHSINIGLRSLPGVKSVKIALATRVNVDVTPQPGAWIDPERIFRQIAAVGFQPRTDELRLRVQGVASTVDGRLTVILSDVGQKPINLTLTATSQDGKRDAESEKVLRDLQVSLLEDGTRTRRVEVEGCWSAAPKREGSASLFVTKIDFLSAI